MKLTKKQKDELKQALNPIVNDSTVEPIPFSELEKEARKVEVLPITDEVKEAMRGFLTRGK